MIPMKRPRSSWVETVFKEDWKWAKLIANYWKNQSFKKAHLMLYQLSIIIGLIIEIPIQWVIYCIIIKAVGWVRSKTDCIRKSDWRQKYFENQNKFNEFYAYLDCKHDPKFTTA